MGWGGGGQKQLWKEVALVGALGKNRGGRSARLGGRVLA